MCLEELADVLHFVVSIGLDMNISPESLYVPAVAGGNDVRNILLFSLSVLNLYTMWEKTNIHDKETYEGLLKNQYELVMGSFECVVKELGYTEDEVQDAFFAKNEVNKERLAQNY